MEFSFERQCKIANAVKQMMEYLGMDLSNQHFVGTPRRVALMFEEFTQGYDTETAKEILSHMFDSDNDEMVVLPNIDAVSLCPHHLLPSLYTAHVGYIPHGVVLGLSKIPRLIKHLASKPVIQEDLVTEIAHVLEQALHPVGVMVVLDGQHLCMRARGIREKDSVTRTSCTLGVFQTDAACKAEFLALINSKR